MGGEAGVGLQRVVVDGPDDRPDHHRHHDPEDHPGVPQPREHPPVHQHQRKREEHHRHAGDEVRQRRRVLERVRVVHAVEAAAVGAELLHRHEDRQRTDHDRLLLRLRRCPSCPWRPGSSVETCSVLWKVIGLPCCRKMNDTTKATGRNMYITTRHISTKKLPIVLSPRSARMIAVSAAEPDRRGQEEVGDAEEELAEIREVLVARVVLDVGVGHERDDGVKDRRRRQHALALRDSAASRAAATAPRSRRRTARVLKISNAAVYCFQFCGPLFRRSSNQRRSRGGRYLPSMIHAR